jgi:DNA-binding GntR family transcriptional regulator
MAASTDLAYQKIRSMILGGEFGPGERLPERHLVEVLGVSRTPVREALRKLNAEGLVMFEPNRGARVQEIDPGDINDLFELGVSLEGFAAGLAARRADSKDIAHLEAILAELEDVISILGKISRSAYTELDFKFHSQIVHCSGNRRLESTVRQVVGIPALVNIYVHYDLSHYERSFRQHREIFEAIRAGDAEWASAAMRNHILSGKHQLGNV